MSHHAHGTNRVKGHATRVGEMQVPSPTSTFFDDLHPHLRNVYVEPQALADRIYEYLKRRPGRTVALLCKKFSYTERRIRKCLTDHPDLFRREGRNWFVLHRVETPRVNRRTGSGPLSALIEEFLRTNGPAVVREIAKGIGYHDSRYLSNVIARPPCRAVRVGKRKNLQLWALPDEVAEEL